MSTTYGFPVETDAYDGPAKRAYDRIWSGKRLVSGLVGLAGLVAVAADAYAEPPRQVAYAGTNLASFGVPDVSGMTPYRTRWLDKTDAIPGDETRMDFYQSGDAVVATYTLNGGVYGVAVDRDGVRPVDLVLVDRIGNGIYERTTDDIELTAPGWAIR